MSVCQYTEQFLFFLLFYLRHLSVMYSTVNWSFKMYIELEGRDQIVFKRVNKISFHKTKVQTCFIWNRFLLIFFSQLLVSLPSAKITNDYKRRCYQLADFVSIQSSSKSNIFLRNFIIFSTLQSFPISVLMSP